MSRYSVGIGVWGSATQQQRADISGPGVRSLAASRAKTPIARLSGQPQFLPAGSPYNPWCLLQALDPSVPAALQPTHTYLRYYGV